MPRGEQDQASRYHGQRGPHRAQLADLGRATAAPDIERKLRDESIVG